jgi:hypothetical protein
MDRDNLLHLQDNDRQKQIGDGLQVQAKAGNTGLTRFALSKARRASRLRLPRNQPVLNYDSWRDSFFVDFPGTTHLPKSSSPPPIQS